MQTVATANVNDDADTAGMPHVNTGLPSFKDARPPKLQPSCPTSSPRLRQQAAHHSKREAQSRRRRKDRYEQLRYPMLGRGKEKDRKQSAYDEEFEISSDDDDIKNSVLLRTPSGNISRADKLRQAGPLSTPSIHIADLEEPSIRIADLGEPELEPDVEVSATPALSTPPPTP
jgi:hypothetical protein